ncbi:MAG TPA: hypothetical protein DEB24_02530 [Coriobacteriia bacterium]|nr:hypothetical protein [Coriobacteriia bacterium]
MVYIFDYPISRSTLSFETQDSRLSEKILLWWRVCWIYGGIHENGGAGGRAFLLPRITVSG